MTRSIAINVEPPFAKRKRPNSLASIALLFFFLPLACQKTAPQTSSAKSDLLPSPGAGCTPLFLNNRSEVLFVCDDNGSLKSLSLLDSGRRLNPLKNNLMSDKVPALAVAGFTDEGNVFLDGAAGDATGCPADTALCSFILHRDGTSEAVPVAFSHVSHSGGFVCGENLRPGISEGGSVLLGKVGQIDIPNGKKDLSQLSCEAVNNSGTQLLSGESADGSLMLLSSDGKEELLNVPSKQSSADAMNDLGEVLSTDISGNPEVGLNKGLYLLTKEERKLIPSANPAEQLVGNVINNNEVVGGVIWAMHPAGTPQTIDGFLWSRRSGLKRVAELFPEIGEPAAVYDLNDKNEIITCGAKTERCYLLQLPANFSDRTLGKL